MGALRRRGPVGAAALALSLALAACGGGGGGTGGGEGGDDVFSVQIIEPENPLVPSNTTESEGNQVLHALFTGLVTYDQETTELTYDGVAESVESDDNQTFTVRLKDGWTFHDGTPVTADSYIDAWNYAALSTNAQGASYFFERIEGYDALQAETDDEGNVVAEPTATEMTGLERVDDRTFRVRLKAPFAQFPIQLGYTAYFPLPQGFFDDPEAFGRQPVGNGPFRADSEFTPGQGITLTRYEEYAGSDPAQAGGVEFRVYDDVGTAYTDMQAGNLDIVRPRIPPELIPTAQEELGDRFIERESAAFDYIAFPTYDPRFADPRVRRAFSMAIDREAITEGIFSGAREPAYDIIPPTIDGHRPDACEYCRYDPERAAALLAETDFDTSQPVDLWFNAGGAHDQWMTAVGNQLRENLGVDYVLRGELGFEQYIPLMDSGGMTGPFRLGWAMDYPSPENFLAPLFSTAALPPGSNHQLYSNPEFDRLVQAGNEAGSNEEAIAFYQQADDVLLEDMAVAPMFFARVQVATSEQVDGVVIDAFELVRLSEITLAE